MPDLTTSAAIDSLMQAADAGDARTALGLGTAATSAAADFATAAQGGKADTAVQPGALGGAASLNVGTTAGTVAAGDHTHTGLSVQDAATPSVRALGTGATEAAAGNDARLSDARTPTAHTHAAGDITSGTIDAGRLPVPTTTTLGGVKRNAGTAGQYVTGIDSAGALTFDTPAGGGSGGKVVAIKHASSNARQSSSSTTWADITSLSITHTPASASNKVLLIASINGASNATNANLGIRFVRDSTAVGVGDNEATNRTAVGQAIMSPGTDAAGSLTHVFVDEPATTASATWKAQFAALQTSGVVYINRTSNDSNNVFSPRGLCTLTLIEFAP